MPTAIQLNVALGFGFVGTDGQAIVQPHPALSLTCLIIKFQVIR